GSRLDEVSLKSCKRNIKKRNKRGKDRTDPVVLNADATLNPNPAAPLVVIVHIETNEPTSACLRVSTGYREWVVSSSSATNSHAVNIFGLRPATTAAIDGVVVDAGGNDTSLATMEVTTAPLPDDFPPMTAFSEPRRMAKGYTFFGVGRWMPGAREENYGLAMAVDNEGQVVWYYKTDVHAVDDVQRISNGNLLIVDLSNLAGQAIEIDMLGNIVQRWQPRLWPTLDPDSTFVDTDTLHHDMLELPNGNFLTLSTELRVVEDFPTLDPESPTETANVVGDIVVELTRDGTIVSEWSTFDMFDVHRIGYLSVIMLWNGTYATSTRAWTWANAVFYDERDDSILVSSRHQNAIVKFSRSTGEVRWILSDPTGWGSEFQQYLLQPEEGTTFPYAQHAVEVTRRGTIILHDNGNFRAMPPNPPIPATENFSRAIEYRIDERAMTFKEVWSFGGNQYYANFVGDADPLRRNNRLITFGGQVKTSEGVPTDVFFGSSILAQILEIDLGHDDDDGDDSDDIVFELTIGDLSGRHNVYRSERLPSIGPR
ncbi:MAG: aryl-sulfate sulfotransferase, partial [Acidiferrobacterales bacterium]|nr:aryl-sulfate sulfotransferase [Acidiferrobacterales bacterium]